MKRKPSKVSTLPAPPGDVLSPSSKVSTPPAVGGGRGIEIKVVDEKRELRVVRSKTKEVVHRVDVSGRTDQMVEKVMSGMLRNMADGFHVEDSADDAAKEK